MLTASWMTDMTWNCRPDFKPPELCEGALRVMGLDPLDAPETMPAGSVRSYLVNTETDHWIDLPSASVRGT